MFAIVPRMQNFMRAPSFKPFKRWWYRCFADPYTNLRNEPLEVTAVFGARFRARLSGVVQRSLFHFGVFEPNLTAFLSERLRPGDTFVDVGANVGYFTLLASKLVGDSGRVVAIEASPATFAALNENIVRNEACNVRTANVAAYDCETTLPIYHLPDEEFTSGASVVRAIGPQEAAIPARPLPSIMTETERASARVIKIDVEGAEERVVEGLLGATHSLREDVEIVVEVLPESYRSVIAKLGECGFVASVLKNPLDPLADAAGSTELEAIAPSASPERFTMAHGVLYLVFARARVNGKMVETTGIEPATSCLQSRRSTN